MGKELLCPRMLVSVETVLTFRRTRGLKRIREKECLFDAMAEEGRKTKSAETMAARRRARGTDFLRRRIQRSTVEREGIGQLRRVEKQREETHVGHGLVGQDILASNLEGTEESQPSNYRRERHRGKETHLEIVNVHIRVDVRKSLPRLCDPLLIVRHALSFSKRRNRTNEMNELSVILQCRRGVNGFEELDWDAGRKEELSALRLDLCFRATPSLTLVASFPAFARRIFFPPG